MSDEDEFLAAWLKAREYQVVEDNFGNVFLRKRHVTADKTYDVGPKHIAMWVDPMLPWHSVWATQLFKEQRGKRRPLRGLLREWVLGL